MDSTSKRDSLSSPDQSDSPSSPSPSSTSPQSPESSSSPRKPRAKSVSNYHKPKARKYQNQSGKFSKRAIKRDVQGNMRKLRDLRADGITNMAEQGRILGMPYRTVIDYWKRMAGDLV